MTSLCKNEDRKKKEKQRGKKELTGRSTDSLQKRQLHGCIIDVLKKMGE